MLPIVAINPYVSGLLGLAAASIDNPSPLSILSDHVRALPAATSAKSLRQVGEELRVTSWQAQDCFEALAADNPGAGTLAAQLYGHLFNEVRTNMAFFEGWSQLCQCTERVTYLGWAAGLDRTIAYALATVAWSSVTRSGYTESGDNLARRRTIDQALAEAGLARTFAVRDTLSLAAA